MINGKKIIGVCVTRIQQVIPRTFVDSLYEKTKNTDYRIMVFNSFTDFFEDNKKVRGAKAIYKMINFDIIDVLLIRDDSFLDDTVKADLIAAAREKNVPIIMVHADREGCYSIQNSFDNTFEELVEHIVADHEKKDVFFLAGIKGESDSEKRMTIYKKVMEKHGLPVLNDMIAYGDYWEMPVERAIDNWINRSRIPEAIICVNDATAVTVCNRLKGHGFLVPEDIIVTGFDGLQEFMFHSPRLTTVYEDVELLTGQCIKMITEAFEKRTPPYTTCIDYTLYRGESCGCCQIQMDDYRAYADELSRKSLDMSNHENHIMNFTEYAMDGVDFGQISSYLAIYIMDDSRVCLNNDFLTMNRKEVKTDLEKPFTEDLIVVNARGDYRLVNTKEVFKLEDMYPDLEKMIDTEEMYIFQAVYVADQVFGYYALHTNSLARDAHRINRVTHMINIAYSTYATRMKQQLTNISRMEDMDLLTGLQNSKGLFRYFDEKYEEISQKALAVTVYNMTRYQYIYEKLGIAEAEEAVKLVAESIQLSNPKAQVVARIADDNFVAINVEDYLSAAENQAIQSIGVFKDLMETHNRSRDDDHYIEVNSGYTATVPGWENDIASLIKVANSEMYLGRLKQGKGPVIKIVTAKESYLVFEKLIAQNNFRYAFQPIIDAKSGQIYGYEALMRMTGEVQLSPKEILKIAEECGRLYDIEYATLNNVLEYVDNNLETFGGKRIFINSIPGHFLSMWDKEELVGKYAHLFKYCTIEITEQDEATDEEVQQIMSLTDGEHACQFAVDDYGTGYSNIANLLRFRPHVIKIDRYLIANLQSDKDKQMFISNTVEFARRNNILTLAEGVETFEEMSKLIEMGVDLMQGFYLARPEFTVIREINQHVVDYIIAQNVKYALYDNDNRIYCAQNGEKINLLELAIAKNTTIQLDGGSVYIRGEKNHTIPMNIEIADNTFCRLTLQDVNMKGREEVTIKVGSNCNAEIQLLGENTFEKAGIFVPENSTLILRGSGTLKVKANGSNAVCVGSRYTETHGNITVDMDGKLALYAYGDKAIGIGGGISANGAKINLVKGNIFTEVKAISAVGIGCVSGSVDIRIGNVILDMVCVANESVGIGTQTGTVSVDNYGILKMMMEGEHSTAIGVMDYGSGKVTLAGPSIEIESRGAKMSAIGSYYGDVEIVNQTEYLNIFSEGDSICGIGNYEGEGNIHIKEGTVKIHLGSEHPLIMGGKNTPIVISGGNILTEEAIFAVSPHGEELIPYELEDRMEFSQTINSAEGSYLYEAKRRSTEERFCVYLPKGTKIND